MGLKLEIAEILVTPGMTIRDLPGRFTIETHCPGCGFSLGYSRSKVRAVARANLPVTDLVNRLGCLNCNPAKQTLRVLTLAERPRGE